MTTTIEKERERLARERAERRKQAMRCDSHCSDRLRNAVPPPAPTQNESEAH